MAHASPGCMHGLAQRLTVTRYTLSTFNGTCKRTEVMISWFLFYFNTIAFLYKIAVIYAQGFIYIKYCEHIFICTQNIVN